MTAIRQPCVSDLQYELHDEWTAARIALAERDDMRNRAKLAEVLAKFDDLFDARHDCE